MMRFIQPKWPAPACIKAYSTTRYGGVSPPPYHDLNLGEHVGDTIENLENNRLRLKSLLQIPAEPFWIKQIHSNIAICALDKNKNIEADATFTDQINQICVVTTADCLPILLCHHQGTQVAAIHAGWRGLANGIIPETIQSAQFPAGEILAWLGPAIGPLHFEVGPEVFDLFISLDPEADTAFTPSINGRWLANLYTLAHLQLKKLGIHAIYGGEYCTYQDSDNFFSYRRDGMKTGRMASLIWISDSS